MITGKWARCVLQRGDNLRDFLQGYLGAANRRVFLLAGGGFDPRSTALAEELARLSKTEVRALWVRERRPISLLDLRTKAEANVGRLLELLPSSEVLDLNVFAADSAPIGGREIVRALQSVDLSEATDLILDASALSTGILFSAAKYLHEFARGRCGVNLHLFVKKDEAEDFRIRGTPSDTPAFLHGFRGTFTLDSSARAAKLWIPQLVPGRRMMLQNLHTFLDVDDVCPVLPFPSIDPRLGDKLVEEYKDALTRWGVDFRNFVYAAENNPLDLYRTILRLHHARNTAFKETGGSLIVLSPTGSKVLALGALLAALDLDLPVALFESVGYEIEAVSMPPSLPSDRTFLMHLWLQGAAYEIESPGG